jgi:competence protein ComGC
MKLNRRNLERALTVLEVLVIVAVIGIMAALILPQLAHQRPRYRSYCVNNLKQVGLAERQWAIDNHGQYPMSVSVTNGGTKEFVSRGGVYLHFLVLSNELSTPKILHCPLDETHAQAVSNDFSVGFTEANISYFIGVDASQANPRMFLTGDRNLTNGILPPNRLLVLESNTPVGWTKKIHQLQGNIGLADGSVQSLSTSQTREGLANTGVATNRLAMPWD